MKPVLVGWAPPACRPRSSPWDGNAGSRLALLLGLPSRDALLRLVEPVRLFERPNPPKGSGVEQAAGILLAPRLAERHVILAGVAVCRALGVAALPRYVWRRERLLGGYEATVGVIHLPSGRCRALDDDDERGRLRALLCEPLFGEVREWREWREWQRVRARSGGKRRPVPRALPRAMGAEEAHDPMRDDQNRLLLPEEAARLLGISKRTLLRQAKQGMVPHVRLSARLVRFRRPDLALYIDRIATVSVPVVRP